MAIKTNWLFVVAILFISCKTANDKLEDRTLQFYSNKISELIRKGYHIETEFANHKRNKIFYSYLKKPTRLEYFYSAFKRGERWWQEGDIPISINNASISDFELISDTNAVKESDSFCIKVFIYEPLADKEFTCVEAAVLSIGPFENYYVETILCKYNHKGELINYYIESAIT